MVAPDSTVTSGPKTTFGPITTSRPMTVSSANQTVAGVGQRGAVRHRLGAGAGLEGGLGGGEIGAGVDAERLGLGAGDRRRRQPAGAGQRHDVGQVVFALGVVVADRGEQLEERRGVGGHQPGIAEPDRPLVRRRVARLDDRREPAAVVEHQPAVAAGVGGLEAEHHHGRAGRPRVEHRLQRLRADERGVAVEDDHVAVEAGERRRRLQHRMAGAELLAPARRRRGPGRSRAPRPPPPRRRGR